MSPGTRDSPRAAKTFFRPAASTDWPFGAAPAKPFASPEAPQGLPRWPLEFHAPGEGGLRAVNLDARRAAGEVAAGAGARAADEVRQPRRARRALGGGRARAGRARGIAVEAEAAAEVRARRARADARGGVQVGHVRRAARAVARGAARAGEARGVARLALARAVGVLARDARGALDGGLRSAWRDGRSDARRGGTRAGCRL